MARVQADPLNTSDLQALNKTLSTQIDRDQKVLAQYQTLPPILPPLLLRIGRAYSMADQHWEAAVVFRELRRRYPTQSEVEAALYGSIIVFDQAKQTSRALALSNEYLTKYPQGKYAESVGYLRGVLAYDEEKFDQAIGYFEDCLKNQPNNSRREQIELILGDVQLRQTKFDAAIASYQKFQKDFPTSSRVEAAVYRSGLALLFGGKAQQADAAFRDYMKKYPSGTYVPDAAYRLDVIQFAAKQYDTVISDGMAWQQKYGKATPLAEVLSLMGDAYASTNRSDDAVKAYTQSYKAAQTPDVLSYSLFAAAKILQKQANWTAILSMFQDFMKANPDTPLLVESIVWIGRADVKLGKVGEARQFMADTAKQYLNDPNREAVDEILTQLALLYAKKHSTPAPSPAATLSNTAFAHPQTEEVSQDPAQDLEKILMKPELVNELTSQSPHPLCEKRAGGRSSISPTSRNNFFWKLPTNSNLRNLARPFSDRWAIAFSSIITWIRLPHFITTFWISSTRARWSISLITASVKSPMIKRTSPMRWIFIQPLSTKAPPRPS